MELEKTTLKPGEKILVVCHSAILKAFSASGVEMVQPKEGVPPSPVGPGQLVGAKIFDNCEVLPVKI